MALIKKAHNKAFQLCQVGPVTRSKVLVKLQKIVSLPFISTSNTQMEFHHPHGTAIKICNTSIEKIKLYRRHT